MRIGWGISGTGDIVQKAVAPAVLAQADSDLVAFCSRSDERGAEMAARFDASAWYTDYRAFCADARVQAVYVAGEVARHCPETVAAAEAGKHVVCEKPMALDADEGRRMVAACAANGVQLTVAYYRRYYPLTQRLKQMVDDGAVGRPLQAAIDMAYTYNPPPGHPQRWRIEPAGGGGALQDIGSHRLDILCWLLGEPSRVAGFTAHLAHDWWAPDTETLMVEFASGAQATCRCSWASGANQDTFEVFGTTGALLAGAFEDRQFIWRRRGRPDEVIEVGPVADNRHRPLIDDVARRLTGGLPLRYDGQVGLQATRIIAGCYRSQATRQVVEV